MREVEVTGFVPATPAEVERALTPATVVEYEGSFDVKEVAETDDGWVVTAGARRLGLTLAFEEREDGLVYRQRGTAGPFDAMKTTLTVEPRDEGSVVTMRSQVRLGVPPAALFDRVAAWKRRAELGRVVERLADDFR